MSPFDPPENIRKSLSYIYKEKVMKQKLKKKAPEKGRA